MKKKIITFCSSMAFYKDVLTLGEVLEKKGFAILYPESALLMKERNDFEPSHFKDAITPQQRGVFIQLHFDKITKGDAILIVNKTKNGIKGYIGGNVLMEMAIAFNLKKKIYLLHPISKKQPFQEEIIAMNPIMLKGKLDSIK